MSTLTDTDSLARRQQELAGRLAALAGRQGAVQGARQSGNEEWDEEPGSTIAPLRTDYLHAMLRRASGQRPNVAQRLLDRIEVGISVLEKQSHPAVGEGGCKVSRSSCTPRFQSTHRLMAQTRLTLVQLNRELAGAHHPVSGPTPSALAAALAEQDRIFKARLSSVGDALVPVPKSGLHAARHLDTLRSRFQLDQLIATALVHQPETPGPLNPQRLLVRLLTTLHELSPSYLMHTLDHSRTLFGLQHSGGVGDTPRGARTKK